ncbi:hypothetical protein MWU75_11595 [Ornithinimicrobium sp. F0845]|uniref:hypothetical protein n=1 Tax=Ornithinimicrobium sp. F0845 TaxID=2926412 RepID=UPI001FF5A381|nr:hypothetical protein [Ornithinimicrobium sp. F0845]MCK0112784.1 hypothetical protein [Ornithinimicrobium sp. F0845]
MTEIRAGAVRALGSLRRSARQVCEVLDLYAFPVKGPQPPADPSRLLEDATEPVLRQLRESGDLDERRFGILVERLANSADRTLIIRDEHGEACGYCHITLGDTTDERTNFAIQVLPHQGYLWDDRIFPGHRRRGLHTFSIARRLELIAEEGRTEALTIIARHNRASRRSYAPFGTARRRVLYYLPQGHRTISRPAIRRARLRDHG